MTMEPSLQHGRVGQLLSAPTMPHGNGTPTPPPPVFHRDRRADRSKIFSEEVFQSLLVQERKRADRSNRPFILLSLKADEPLDPDTSQAGKAALDALTAATRETDLVGWLRSPSIIGVIFSELGETEPPRAVDAIRSRIRGELEQRLGVATTARFVLEFHVYPEPTDRAPEPDAGTIDPVLHPDLVSERRQRRVSNWVKRVLDVLASSVLLCCLAPLFVAIAALVRLTSRGPILFRQIRLGELGKPFTVLKFRTMYVNVAEKAHHDFVTRFIKESGRGQAAANGQLFKLTNDRRITPLGRLLRKTSLDELPQIWNVLRGDMSLVGPRPPIPYEIEHYAPWHRRRVLEAKPGITGLWQVTSRSRSTFDEMVRLDLRYARTRSLWKDLGILLRTPRAVVSGKGAC